MPTIDDHGHDLPCSTRTPTRHHHHARRPRGRGNGRAESLTNEARVTLAKALGGLKSFTYIYDYGD
ncbi:hypothetical protein SB778_37880, partial [Paraburkholderia sp. SIMBA_050]